MLRLTLPHITKSRSFSVLVFQSSLLTSQQYPILLIMPPPSRKYPSMDFYTITLFWLCPLPFQFNQLISPLLTLSSHLFKFSSSWPSSRLSFILLLGNIIHIPSTPIHTSIPKALPKISKPRRSAVSLTFYLNYLKDIANLRC